MYAQTSHNPLADRTPQPFVSERNLRRCSPPRYSCTSGVVLRLDTSARAMSVNSRSIFRFCCSDVYPSLRFRLFSSEGGGSGGGGNNSNNSSFESGDDFERRFFGDVGNSADNSSFFRKLDKIEQAHGRSFSGLRDKDGGNSRFMDGQGEGFDTLSDGMDSKLKKAASTFAYTDEILEDDYKFRPDMTFKHGTTYTLRDLDLTKPGIPRGYKKPEFEITTKEVLKKADFRNVRFLSKFLTDAGIMIKRSQTKISAKAQRKVAREIKTARALGLMPFTTMGTKPFIFGKTMEDNDEDYEQFEYDKYSGASTSALDDV